MGAATDPVRAGVDGLVTLGVGDIALDVGRQGYPAQFFDERLRLFPRAGQKLDAQFAASPVLHDFKIEASRLNRHPVSRTQTAGGTPQRLPLPQAIV